TSIAVAEGQKYPSSLDPNKVPMTDMIKALPAYDPTGTLQNLVFRDPNTWNPMEKEYTKAWNRVVKGG
ncbi:MAG: spermidine/putrescine ABC transporter substrate-binding protein, partial [Albidovulum sp.]